MDLAILRSPEVMRRIFRVFVNFVLICGRARSFLYGRIELQSREFQDIIRVRRKQIVTMAQLRTNLCLAQRNAGAGPELSVGSCGYDAKAGRRSTDKLQTGGESNYLVLLVISACSGKLNRRRRAQEINETDRGKTWVLGRMSVRNRITGMRRGAGVFRSNTVP